MRQVRTGEEESMNNNNITPLGVIAIVAALALLGVVVVTVAVTIQLQQAEARGCPLANPAVNASKGRCFHP
jgi:hypothetical protein